MMVILKMMLMKMMQKPMLQEDLKIPNPDAKVTGHQSVSDTVLDILHSEAIVILLMD